MMVQLTESLPKPPIRKPFANNRAALGTFVVFLVMMAIFFVGNPSVFSDWLIYRAVLITLPVALFLVVPLVFIVTVGEIDLSFPAVMGFSCWIFSLGVQAGYDPFLSFIAGVLVGIALGAMIGTIVVYLGLSSLIATLGLSYLIRGVILVATSGRSIALVDIKGSTLYQIFAGTFLGLPTQMLWATLFVIGSIILYNRHQFGARVKCVGDNPDSASQMGINTKRIRVYTFVFMGFGAALAGIVSTMINFTWWPSAGEAYLLPSLAAVFVGGTPTWGGIGTIVGGAFGALIVSFIQVGIVSAGLDGFYVQLFYGLIITLALIGHRWNQVRYR
jgi:simple sugar transport system permease protein